MTIKQKLQVLDLAAKKLLNRRDDFLCLALQNTYYKWFLWFTCRITWEKRQELLDELWKDRIPVEHWITVDYTSDKRPQGGAFWYPVRNIHIRIQNIEATIKRLEKSLESSN